MCSSDLIAPFTEAVLKRVWDVTRPRPRWYLRVLHDLLQLGKDARVPLLDDSFVEPKLERLSTLARQDDAETPGPEDDRLA